MSAESAAAAIIWRQREDVQPDIPLVAPTRRRPRQSYAGWVYVAALEGGYKIGRSRKPETRMRRVAIEYVCPTVQLLHVIASTDARWAERTLHQRYAAKRVGREIFALEDEDLDWIRRIGRLDPPGAPGELMEVALTEKELDYARARLQKQGS